MISEGVIFMSDMKLSEILQGIFFLFCHASIRDGIILYENLPDVFQRNCLQIVLGTWLTDCISNSRLYKKMWFNPAF